MSTNEEDLKQKYAANAEGGSTYENYDNQQSVPAVAVEPAAVVGAVAVENVVANTDSYRVPSVAKDEIKIPDHFTR